MSEIIKEIVHVAEAGNFLYALVVQYEESDGGNGVGLLYRTNGLREGDTEHILSTNDYLRYMWTSPSGSIWMSSEDGNVWTTAKVKWSKPKDAELAFNSYDSSLNWTVTTLPDQQGRNRPPLLGSIWGTDDSNVFVAAFDGPIYHWNGKEWRQVHTAPGTIRSFSGTSANDVFAVGEKGSLLRFDGSAWQTLRNPEGVRNDETFTGARHAPDGSVYICSQSGRLLHGSASGMSVIAQNDDIQLRGLAFLGDRLLFAAADQGVAELKKSTIVSIRDTFYPIFIAPGTNDRLFFLDASTETCYIEYDPSNEDKPWAFVDF
jgi:hypothetical protein